MTAQTVSIEEHLAPAARIWQTGVIAAVVASIANVIVWLIASVFGVTFNVTPPGMPAIPFPVMIIGATVVGVLIGTLVFTLMPRVTHRPVSTFRTVAVIVLVLSLAQPFLLTTGMMPVPEPVGLGTVLALDVMHIVTGVIAIYLLTTRGRA